MDDRRPSKTQRKKAMHELRDLGAELVELSNERLAAIELPERLRDAVMDARRITAHGARRRQMQYIGKIMRKVDAEPIRAALDVWRTKSDSHTAEHKRVESWRERLLADADAVGALVAEYPTANVAKLRALIDGTERERAANQPARAFRQLYQALRELIEGKA
jgi:ribosome-associated protein